MTSPHGPGMRSRWIFAPQADGWKEQDDREVICLVLAADEGPRTGSARGLNL